MKPDMTVEIQELVGFLKNLELYADDLVEIGEAGVAQIASVQKTLVPVDTGETKLSIKGHIKTAQRSHYENEVGPETEYSYYIEFGTTNPNYPIQSFVAPSATGMNRQHVLHVLGVAFGMKVIDRWEKR